jgi:benzoyl-CoA 2,3-dioxygenase component B
MFDHIPNNVDLSHDRKLQKALLRWMPNYLEWWRDMGPTDFAEDQVYLRTAISVEKDGWAHFDYVKMPDYRWGIFLSPHAGGKTIGFGDNMGIPVWDSVPGEHRKNLRRIIVTQADTEPASVEQQRMLGHTAPSLYDLRNLFQVNVEEGRHLWAMVYLLHKFFGRDGREEAEDLLQRRSGSEDSPRILNAFNKPTRDWLAFFCFAMFMDRDGKYQLASLAESGFDPLARTTQFMLTEEAHHLFVGETGVGRVVRRTAELMKVAPAEDVKRLGGIPLDIIQRYINEWFSASVDLFGGEDSSNAATYFSNGLKGRFRESKSRHITDHLALEDVYDLDYVEDGKMKTRELPLRRALNSVLLDNYIEDCERALRRWNKHLEKAGLSDRMTLPSRRFNRNVGVYAGIRFNTKGELIDEATWEATKHHWLPCQDDFNYVESLMKPVLEVGKIANWIAPPARGINKNGFDYEYVRFVDDPYQRRA